MQQQNQEPSEDVRVKTTATIWGISVGMLGISIPLSAVTNSTMIPLAVIAAAAVGTAAVWRSGAKSGTGVANTTPALHSDAAQKRIAELEERLANLETINNFERRLAEEALKRQDAVPIGEIAKDRPTEPTTTSSEPYRITE